MINLFTYRITDEALILQFSTNVKMITIMQLIQIQVYKSASRFKNVTAKSIMLKFLPEHILYITLCEEHIRYLGYGLMF